MDAKLEYTRNETIAFAHKCRANDLRSMIKHFEKWDYSVEDIIEFLSELADASEAQVAVVNLRDELKLSALKD
jgi:hypothetical protein